MKEKIAHPDFAVRMQQAADANPNVPPVNYGRLGWVVEALASKFEYATNVETVRKWFAGETMPRQKPAKLLAEVLNVTPEWLTLGASTDLGIKERKARNALAEGAVNVIVGMVQMAGWNVAFPDAADGDARKQKIDFYAIIRGAKYSFHIVAAVRNGGDWKVSVPAEALETFLIALMPLTSTSFNLIELPKETLLERGKHKGGSVDVMIPEGMDDWRQIKSFAERL